MNINLVLANNFVLDKNTHPDQLKRIGSLWGGWRTCDICATDNVICHSGTKAAELIDQGFNLSCNFYIPNSVFMSLDKPDKVFNYGGTFAHEVVEQDEIVAMHLAAGHSDIVLLLGFDWSKKPLPTDPDQLLLRHNYLNLVQSAISTNFKVQWVLCDHPGEPVPEIVSLSNFTQDRLANVFTIMSFDK
jgi:hypothetical protein